MSKLEIVRKALEENPLIIIAGVEDRNYLPGKSGYWSHTINFFIAPKNPIYSIRRLQEFLSNLIPVSLVIPTQDDEFRDEGPFLSFGKLYYDEDIGTETIQHEIKLTEEGLIPPEKLENGKLVLNRTERIQRRTWVSLYPNFDLAKNAIDGLHEYRIEKKILQLHIPVADRIGNFLSSGFGRK